MHSDAPLSLNLWCIKFRSPYTGIPHFCPLSYLSHQWSLLSYIFHHLHLTTPACIHIFSSHTFLPSQYPASQIFCHSHRSLHSLARQRVSSSSQKALTTSPTSQSVCMSLSYTLSKKTTSLLAMLPSLRANPSWDVTAPIL